MNPIEKTGVLLVNLGTPDEPTPRAVRRYLREFLSDPRVVEIPKPIWWLILNGLVLPFRPRKAAKAYQAIWSEKGSPLRVFTESLAVSLNDALKNIRIEVAMRYGKPSIQTQLEKLKASGITHIIVLPLYPQYSAATGASIFDAVSKTLKGWRHIPKLTFVSDYHAQPAYIEAVGDSISRYWQAHGKPELLLMSFHGLPERTHALGDPYYVQCLNSARLIAAHLGLAEKEWKVVFQSRFGRAQWLKPYCVNVLQELPKEGVKAVDLVCPGFAVDCLETLEEIAIANKEIFMASGGSHYRYIPALNDSPEHAKVLAHLILNKSQEN